MGRMIGIDLGTTNSVVATVDAGGCRILQNKENEQQTRSAVGVYKGEYLVGSPAIRRWPADPKNTIISIKRIIGRSINDPEVAHAQQSCQYKIVQPSDGTRDSLNVILDNKEISPVEISALILRKLKEDAELVLGEPVTHAVITVPAYFSEKQKHATREAGLKAGLAVMKIIEEPTAAAVAYGIDSGEKQARMLLVYDLGGGTFDISIMMMATGVFANMNLAGDMWLGGDNFDQLIIDDVLPQIREACGHDPTDNHRFMATLRLDAQKAKETLSSAHLAQIFVPGLLQDQDGNLIDIELDITREHFEELARPLVERTVALVRKAVEEAHLSFSDIDQVLMAGNATGIPLVQSSMEELFGKGKVLRKIHPKYCVAMGAAMTASVLKGIICPKCETINMDMNAVKCCQCGATLALNISKTCPACGQENDPDAEVCCNCQRFFIQRGSVDGGTAPFSFGIQTANDTYFIFINKNDHYPSAPDKIQTQSFQTSHANQRTIIIPVFGGDRVEAASLNEKQGEAMAILPPLLPSGTTIKIRLWLDKDGSFDLNAFLEDGTDLRPTILRGNIDQKVMEKMEKIEVELNNPDNFMAVEQRKKLDDKHNEIFRDIQDRKYQEADAEADELLQKIRERPQMANGDIRQQAENLVHYVEFLISQYDWLMGSSLYSLTEMKEKLSAAIASRDRSQINESYQELEKALNDMMTQNQALAVFVGIEIRIGVNVRPLDAAKADELQAELHAIAMDFKNSSPQAAERLGNFSKLLMQVLHDLPSEGKTALCPVCGTENPLGTRNCSKCKNDLWLLEGKSGSFSTGFAS